MPDSIRPVILCGGAGTRLWPASRDSLPKQFLKLLGPQSTLQETLARVSDPALFSRPVVVTNRDYRFLVREQLEEIGIDAEILLEPARRDSGPAVAAATAHIAAKTPKALVLVLAADHVVRDPAAFVAACRDARPAAEAGHIVTFGLKPDHPATAYGYIRPGQPIPNAAPARAVETFVEKPDTPTAERYVKDGYLWNSGNFLFRADVLLAEYSAFNPASAETIAHAVKNAADDLGFRVLDETAFASAEQKSIDYAVMEKTRRAAVVPASYGWSDVGGWNAVWELLSQDANRNAADGEVVFLDSSGSYVLSKGRLAALVRSDSTRLAELIQQKSGPDTREFAQALDSRLGRMSELVSATTMAAVNEVARQLSEITGKPIRATRAPVREGDVRHSRADIEKAREKLGFTPRTSLRDGLERTFSYWRTTPRRPRTP